MYLPRGIFIRLFSAFAVSHVFPSMNRIQDWLRAVHGQHHSDVSVHQGSAIFCGHQERFSRRVPFRGLLFRRRQRHDVRCGVLQRCELLTLQRLNRFVEGPRPVSHDAPMTGQRRRRDDRTLCRACVAAGRWRSRHPEGG